MKLLKKAATASPLGEYNPFVKPGDIICLKNKPGRYKVLKTSTEGLKLSPASAKSDAELISCDWNDFAGWRSR